MNEEEIHICKEHNQNITHVQYQPNGVAIGLCEKCFDQFKIMPINQASQIAQQTRQRQITIVRRAENTDSKELMKMLKTFKNLKQLLQDKIDEIIKVIEEGQKKLKNEFSSQIGNLSTQLNIFSHVEVMQTGEVFRDVKEEIKSYVKKYNDELIQLVKAVIEDGMASTQTISVPPQQPHEIQQQINQQPPQEIQQSQQQPQIQQPQIIQQPPQLQPQITKQKITLISQAPVNSQQPPQQSQVFFQQPIQQTQNESLQFLQISQTPQQQYNQQSFSSQQQQQQAMMQSQGISFQPPQQQVQSPEASFFIQEVPMQPQNGFSQQPLLRSQSFSQEIHQTKRQNHKIRVLTSTTSIQKEFKYELRSQLRVDQCNAMVIGMNDKYFVNGFSTEIQIWKFDNGVLSQPINIKGNNSQVVCLCFSKKSNWLISGFLDGTMKILQQQENGDWNCIQTLNSLKNIVKYIVLTPQEDQFLSCSDSSIQVWMKNQINEWNCFQTVTETAVQLLFLTSTDYDGRLIIWQRQQSNMWQEKQVIENPYNDKYIRICFVEDNELIATTENEGKLIQFYEQNGLFRQVAEYPQNTPQKEQITSVFPIVYNNQYKVAIVRHHNYVLIFLKSSNGQFIQKSFIQGNFWSGDLSSDSKFLFMWEKENKSIIVMESV